MREFECVSNRVQFHSTELYKGLQNISTGVAQTLLVGVWVNDDQEGIKGRVFRGMDNSEFLKKAK